MKMTRNTLVTLLLLVIVAAVYRIIPNRPAGFAPQMAMALFGGALISDKKWAFALPVLSLLLSDLLYQFLYLSGAIGFAGFYSGQWATYLCFMGITVFGFLLKRLSIKNIILFGIAGSVIFFITSNFFTWLGGGGFARPKTWEGLMMCYNDALLYYRNSGLIHGFAGNFIIGDLFFTFLLFGGYYLVRKYFPVPRVI